ncbi:uncharacterized protein J4E78_009359 [Alternaria triticimaculans]|uniref:uncharacterized protein n=1 Tax=Alternaria triticimaculans TaxID=297637 RepID=UPI0020C5920E|nr:uncharacterized protein J4E78_009359 [Alternaria triticimaculans]KAI4645449.1 hypothetical protein J4E78_009359 [Alternaria triticimaculans]
MPPIPIHKNAPIAPTTAAKPDGITPSTASSDPDNASNPPPTRTTPAYAPATTTQDASSNPPAPQPGARPAAPTGSVGMTEGNDRYTPAAPQAGAVPTATVITTETRQAPPPPQFSHPPPSDSMLAGRSTVTATTASKPGPTTLNYGPAASPFQSADQAQPTRTSLEHPPGYVQAMDNAPYTAGGGIGQSSGAGDAEGEGVGAQAWSMLNKAGEALKKGEESVWRAVQGKNGGGF